MQYMSSICDVIVNNVDETDQALAKEKCRMQYACGITCTRTEALQIQGVRSQHILRSICLQMKGERFRVSFRRLYVGDVLNRPRERGLELNRSKLPDGRIWVS
jgi:hypothetical protein